MTRMIDADALTDRIEADKKQDNISPGNFFLFKAYIMNAPTIEPSGDLISRQDAIDALGEEPPVWYDGDDEIAERNQWRRDKAAIEALPSAEASQDLAEPNKELKGSDLIRREDAIHILACEMYAEAQAEGYEVGSVEDYIPEAKAWMSDAPSAEPKTGKWILDPNGMDWNIPAWRCSECGFVANYIGVEANGLCNSPMNWAGSKFCPQCGARITGYER